MYTRLRAFSATFPHPSWGSREVRTRHGPQWGLQARKSARIMTVTVCPPGAGVGWALHVQAGRILPAPQEVGHLRLPDEKPSSCRPQHHPSSLDPASILARTSWGNRARPSLQTHEGKSPAWWGSERDEGRGEGSQPGHQHQMRTGWRPTS